MTPNSLDALPVAAIVGQAVAASRRTAFSSPSYTISIRFVLSGVRPIGHGIRPSETLTMVTLPRTAHLTRCPSLNLGVA